MPRYSVADAKNGLPRLIDEALAGADVVITRHGRPVAKLRPVREETSRPTRLDWLASRRLPRVDGAPDSVEMLRRMYEDED